MASATAGTIVFVGCDLAFVDRTLGLLAADGGAECWIFGGWAEELRGLSPARRHKDLDLLFVGQNFAAVERLLAARRLNEVEGKHFAHKRAFLVEDFMVELFLVERDSCGFFTNFWGTCRHDWPDDVLSSAGGLPVASAAALAAYRAAHPKLTRTRSQLSAV
jgi:hypothetical protein